MDSIEKRPSGTSQPAQPNIIPRAEHTLSRKNVDDDALKVLYRLHRHGFLGYLVGGSVRDLLLGRRPKDFDMGTDAHPNQVRKLFRNSRIIGRRFRLVQVLFRGGKVIEVSTFRRLAEDEDDADAVLQANNTFGSPAEDALRRDLTINALFYNIADFSLVDYVGGLADLNAGVIRGVGDPQVRFHRDPVRVLRAVRHAARTGFILEPTTRRAVENHREELKLCPPSRVRDELLRDLGGGAAAPWLGLAHETQVLYSLLPTLRPYYSEAVSTLRARARELLAKVDLLVAQGQPPSDPVILSALFWPALEAQAEAHDFPRGRAGRAQWSVFVREAFPALAAPVQFAKRSLERASQILGVMSFLRKEQAGTQLPKKLTTVGYFPDAVELAKLLGGDLMALVSGSGPAGGRRPRRRRRRRKKRPAKTGEGQA